MALPIINLSLLPAFPANVIGADPIVIAKAGLTYTFGWDITKFWLNPSPDAAQIQILGYNADTGSTERYALSEVQTGLEIEASQISDSSDTGRAVLTGAPSEGRAALELGDIATLNAGIGLSSNSGSLNVQIGSSVQGWDADLDALAALTGTNNIYYRSAADTWSPVTISTGLAFSAGALSWSGFNVRKNSTGSVLTRRRLNLIEGTGIALTVADDGANDEVDVTVATTGSGSPAPLPTTTPGIGEVANINPGANANQVLPAGGTWFWISASYVTSGANWAQNIGCGIAAGGTTVKAAVGAQTHTGIAWRIT